jgi:hypothetical protein
VPDVGAAGNRFLHCHATVHFVLCGSEIRP